jgi:hypothetical protein
MFLTKLLQWRKTSRAITQGTMKHFIPQNVVYIYFRSLGDEVVMVVSNNTSKSTKIDFSYYDEALQDKTYGVDVISGLKVQLDADYMDIKGHSILILELR